MNTTLKVKNHFCGHLSSSILVNLMSHYFPLITILKILD